MAPKPDYQCCRCGYTTHLKANMRKHLYQTKKTCPCILHQIELTEDVKQHIMDNRFYKPPKEQAKEQLNDLNSLKSVIKQLVSDVNILKNNTNKNERFYQAILEKHFGYGHMKTDTGITDITTPVFHAEIKHWSLWKQSVGQLCMYNLSEPRPEKRVYMFDNVTPEIKQTAINGFTSLNINPYEIIASPDEYRITNLTTNESETFSLFN